MSNPVIYSGDPGSTNPRAHGMGIGVGGLFLGWSPLRLTNYTIDTSGVGTVETTGTSSLVNSTLAMQGAGSNLLNEGLMTLQNSQLDLANDSLAGSGMILATQGSTVTVSYSTPIKDTYQQPLTRQEASDIASARPQLISLKSSALNIIGNAANSYSGSVVMDAGSTVNITGALTVGPKNFNVYATGPQLGTVTLSTDQTNHITGAMQIDANLNINNKSGVLEIDGGRLILAGHTAGGTINITAGTLEFAQTPEFLQSPETASESFNTKLAFTGNSGSVQFDGASISSFILEHAPTPTSPTINQIAIFSQGHPIAALDLTPSATPYSASEFSVHGNTLVFHHS